MWGKVVPKMEINSQNFSYQNFLCNIPIDNTTERRIIICPASTKIRDNMTNNYIHFDEYIRQGEPAQQEKAITIKYCIKIWRINQ